MPRIRQIRELTPGAGQRLARAKASRAAKTKETRAKVKAAILGQSAKRSARRAGA